MSKRWMRLVDHGLDGFFGHAGVVLEFHGAAPSLPSLRSRTVPMKLQTAPTRLSPRAQCGDLVGEIEVGGLDADACASCSAPGHRREEGHLGALGQRRRLVAHDLVRAPCARPCRAPGLGIGAGRARSVRRAGAASVVAAVSSGSLPCPMASRMDAKYLTVIFMHSSCRRTAGTARCRRGDGLAGRVVDHAVAPDRRGQHARTLVGETVRGRRPHCAARAGTRGACRRAASRNAAAAAWA